MRAMRLVVRSRYVERDMKRIAVYMLRYLDRNLDPLFIVDARPGGGKSLFTVKYLVPLLVQRGKRVVISVPLRILRDVVSDWLGDLGIEHVVLRARDETCPRVRSIYEDVDDHLRAEIEVLRTCLSCNDDSCPFREALREAMRAQVVVTTHMLADLVTMVSSFDVVVIDEADTIPEVFSSAIPIDVVEKMSRSNDKLLKEVARRIKKRSLVEGRFVVLRPPFFIRTRIKYAISATFCPENVMMLVHATCFGVDKPIDILGEERSVKPVEVRIESNTRLDEFYIHFEKLTWSRFDEWYPKLLSMIAVLGDRHSVVGVVSRTKGLTKRLATDLRDLGFDVADDVSMKIPPRDARIYIVTTRGRWFRGVSLPEAEVIVATYQDPRDNERSMNLALLNVLDEYIASYPQLYSLRAIQNYVANLQSIYRFNRRPQNEHKVLLVDSRFADAIYAVWLRNETWFKNDEKHGRVKRYVTNVFNLSL